MSDEESAPVSANGWPAQGAESHSPSGSPKSATEEDVKAESKDEDAEALSLPVQKRRRVTRACDECRRKKIKCDGKQPCTHCSVYSYECTYDKPSNRRRNPAPQYIEALESRLQRAETLLRRFIPDVDLTDPNLDPAVQQEFRNRQLARARAAGNTQQGEANHDAEERDGQLLSMIRSIGQLDLDEKGGWDFHGVSSGAVFLRLMKEHFGGMLGPAGRAPFLPRPERPFGLMNLDSPQSASSSPFDSSSMSSVELPPQEYAKELCYYSLNCATCLIRIVHIPSFYERLERIYDMPLDNLGQEDTHYLGLLFAVLALGCMYKNLDNSAEHDIPYAEAMEEGLKYYSNARHVLQDITECRDLTSLQGLLFMILFLQATSNLSGCYSFVGIALRSALRMGLHRHLQDKRISPIEQEVRRRVFYVIRQMDIYVSTLLGFPLLLNNEDIDQPYPSEIDDEFIREDSILTPPPGTVSIFEAFNAHTRLMEILAKIIKYVYPMKGLGDSVMKGDTPNATYKIDYSSIREIEQDLQDWFEQLPETWRPSADGPVEVVRVRHLLRFAYAHIQLVLYRPFLHYVSPRLSQGKVIDELSYACAAAAISVSRNIVHIGIEIRKQGVLIGPYWFMLYTEFFAVLSLVFYAIENPQKPGSAEVLGDAIAGKNMIADLADKSMAASRVTTALKVLFDRLPEKSNPSDSRPLPTRKRSMGTSREGSGYARRPGSTTQQRRSDEAARPQRGSVPNGRIPHPPPRRSFDKVTTSSFQDSAFSASLQDLLPVDMSSGATPESSSTGGSAHQQTGQGGIQPVHKLDALMFPSEDPFAYPNGPMMELGFQEKSAGGQGQGSQAQDASQLFMSGSFDDIDGQILSQMPPFILQDHQDVNIPDSVFGQLSTSTGIHPSRPSQGQQSRRSQLQRQQERQLEQMLAAQGYQWNVFSRGGFQGL